jgi:hypothetical protein
VALSELDKLLGKSWMGTYVGDVHGKQAVRLEAICTVSECVAHELGYPVSTRVNHVANDDEEWSVPVELAQVQNRLFS